MVKLKLIEMLSKARDEAAKIDGYVTHWRIELGGNTQYIFKSYGVNPESKHGTMGRWLPEAALSGFHTAEYEVPTNILGTEVKQFTTGVEGVCIAIILHSSGCFHLDIQPSGKNKEKEAYEPFNAPLIECEGKEIKKLSKQELQKVKKEKPGGIANLPSSRRPIPA